MSKEQCDKHDTLLRGIENLLRRCLRHGLLRTEAEVMIGEIEAALSTPSHVAPKYVTPPFSEADRIRQQGPQAVSAPSTTPQKTGEALDWSLPARLRRIAQVFGDALNVEAADRIEELERQLVRKPDYHDDLIEECAKVCEQQIENDEAHGRLQAKSILNRCASAIRAVKFSGSTPSATPLFTREDAAKVVERKAQALSEDPDNGYVEGDTNAFIWTNKEAEWTAIVLEELAEEFRRV